MTDKLYIINKQKNILRIAILSSLLLFCVKTVIAQDSIVNVHVKEVDIIDSTITWMMNDVAMHFRECSFTKEIQSFVVGSQYNTGSNDTYISFKVTPYDETYLFLESIMWGSDSWCSSFIDSIFFLFTYNNDLFFRETGSHILQLKSTNGISYEYMPYDKDYYLPINAIYTYSYKDSCIRIESKCIDLSTMEKQVISKHRIQYTPKKL